MIISTLTRRACAGAMRRMPEGTGSGRRTRNLVLIGFMGCGKSAIGRAISRRLGGRHVDTDQEIERLRGKKIPEIFRDEGEDAFRAVEHTVVRKLTYAAARHRASAQAADSARVKPLIVSTGGGTPLRPENADMLRRIGEIVWLTASTETIVKRVTRNIEGRPLLAGCQNDPAARIESLVAERAPRYAAVAAHSIDTSRFASPDEAAQYIISKLNL